MYCDFFGMSEKPFTVTPNPRFMFLSSNHHQVLAQLMEGIDNRVGFIALTGEIGTGKTTVLRTLLTRLDPSKYSSALIFNSCLSGEQLLVSICREFRIDVAEKNSAAYLDALNSFLLDQYSEGRTAVLVIDEAQNLVPEVLEQVRQITNLETVHTKLIQVILAGQPELEGVLSRYDLRQLSKKISVHCRLAPLNRQDTVGYIEHRLKTSGCRLPGVFSRGAIGRIFRFSGGVPRLINIACDQALVMAWTRESTTVTGVIANRVISEARLEPARRNWLQRFHDRIWSLR